ncbi:hypothetical protein G443_002407 [Actinoalloteichus cyanogriseus DSM 43889]|uniref:ATP-dependent Clp protease adaptor protein ClpS n=1 Tax=Actinoalloteichus caeruleus DSM 43889 TaxID=1120930 RepID=A0ABT1JHZ3_ACTCY|nr:hypothetical protein [Actinoalloteichus caeruleus DSM 43889]
MLLRDDARNDIATVASALMLTLHVSADEALRRTLAVRGLGSAEIASAEDVEEAEAIASRLQFLGLSPTLLQEA